MARREGGKVRPFIAYRRARYIDLQPPLAHGGHTFDHLDPIGGYVGPPLLRCVGCYTIVPAWALTEGFTARCRALLAELKQET